MNDMTLTFGKHRGKKFSEIPQDYLIWLADVERNPKGVIIGGTNWSDEASQFLAAQRRERAAAVQNAPAIFTKLNSDSNDVAGNVKHLVPQLLTSIRSGHEVELSEENMRRLLAKAGYSILSQMSIAETLIWATKAALDGKKPRTVKDADIFNLMDERGNICDTPQSNFYSYGN